MPERGEEATIKGQCDLYEAARVAQAPGGLGGFEKPAAGSPLAGGGPVRRRTAGSAVEPFGVLGRMHAAEEIETGVERTTGFLVGQSARGVSRCLATPDERPVELARSRRLDVMPR